MVKRHEIPTHLNVEDKLLLGLTARQFLYMLSAVALGYSLWDGHPELPSEARLALAAGCVLVGALIALIRPGGRGLDQWVFVVLFHLATPRRAAWRVAEPDPGAWHSGGPAWAEILPRVSWTEDRP
jgi:uncharacterized membrane protein YbhN (UPF0104 family)